MAAPPINLKPLLKEPSETGSRLLDILDAALNADTPAATAAARIDESYPAGQAPAAAEEHLWQLWTLLLGAVKKVPARDNRRMQRLVELVRALASKGRETTTIWGGEARVWAGLPLLGPCMREAWNVSPKLDGSEHDAPAAAAWVSVNAFAARLLGAALQGWTNLAIWGLRAALEEPGPAGGREARLETACEWMERAGAVLRERVAAGEELDEAQKRSLRTGKALEAPPGFSVERWRFWRERMGEMAAETGDGELKARAQGVVETMKGLEG